MLNLELLLPTGGLKPFTNLCLNPKTFLMFNRPSNLRQFLTVLLLVAALGVQALIPAGFMPDFSGDKATIVICTNSGFATITVDQDGQPDHSDKKQQDPSGVQSLCPYATALTGMAPVPEFVAASLLLYEDIALTTSETSCSSATPCKTWIANAPPLSLT